MRIHFDPAKNERNIRLRGLSFEAAAGFDFDGALYGIDERRDYGETRYVAVGMPGRQDAMPKRKALTDATGEVRELTAGDLKGFRSARAALPGSLRRKVGVRGAQRAPTKERITIRLSQDVVTSFRATGDGWQTRVDAALQDWLRTHKPAAIR